MKYRIVSRLVLCWAIFVASPCFAENFASIPFEQRTARAQKISAEIVVDGHGRDWGTYPARYSAAGGADPSRDIISTRVLADASGLRVCVGTRGVPSRDNNAFGFNIDFAETEGADIDLADTVGSGCGFISYTPPGKPSTKRKIEGVQAGIAECVEWFVPWESLAQAIPEMDRSRIVGPKARPWVRITPYSFDVRTHMMTDYGAAAACFRMPRDSEDAKPIASDSNESAELPVVVEGESYVICGDHQGPYGSGDHKTKTCYDLTVMNPSHSPSSIRGSRQNAHYYAFGRKLYSPVAGRIVDARDSIPDHAALAGLGGPSNYAFIKSGTDTVWFVHNKQGSLAKAKGAVVSVGDLVGQIGNTGPSGWALVHLQVQRGSDENNLVPIVFKNVRVSLNGGGNDYWARNLEKWKTQEGFFIETTVPLQVNEIK